MEDAALVFQKGSTGQGPQEGLLGIICLSKSLEIICQAAVKINWIFVESSQ